jgi:hypothetical protein
MSSADRARRLDNFVVPSGRYINIASHEPSSIDKVSMRPALVIVALIFGAIVLISLLAALLG